MTNLTKTNQNIVLIGFMGSGKSTIGRELARRTKRFLIDTDVLIETTQGQDITNIFATYGEQGFREIESNVIIWLGANVCNAVIATGGGMPIFNDIAPLGRIFYLQSEFDVILARLDSLQRQKRPLFMDNNKAKELYEKRAHIYTRVADVVINANKEITEVATDILSYMQDT